MKIGEPLDAESPLPVREIIDIAPVKYDGILDKFVICEPSQAQYSAIIYKNDIGDGIILIDLECDTSLLVDLI